MKRLLLFSLYLGSATAGYAQSDRETIYIDSITVKAFVAKLHKDAEERTGGNYIPVFDKKTAGAWVSEKDIPFLLKEIRSEKKCRCMVHPFSSTMPPKVEYATMGGIAMDIIDNYRGRMPFPGKSAIKLQDGSDYPVWYRCPKTEPERVAEIEKWATQNKKE